MHECITSSRKFGGAGNELVLSMHECITSSRKFGGAGNELVLSMHECITSSRKLGGVRNKATHHALVVKTFLCCKLDSTTGTWHASPESFLEGKTVL